MGESGFPIRYGVMEIDDDINISIGTPQLYKIKVYMACKCYIITELRKYKKDGSFEEKCEVVFLYRKNGETFEKVEPVFSGDECVNKVMINSTYTDFSLAVSEADELNKKSFKEFATTVPYDSDFSTKVKTGKQNHDILLSKYKDNENSLEEMTKYLNGNIKKFTM